MADQGSYIREKLRGAKDAIADDDRPIQQRLWSSYLYNLSSLQAEWLPHVDAQDEFKAIVAKLSEFGEAIEGAGSVPTALWMMSDEEGEQLAARIVALANRYLA
jgi:hypothetical protein